MAKGSLAKEVVVKKIKDAFGDEFIGELDKKIYVWAQDGAERVQIAISLTCPKNQVTISNSDGFGIDFENPTIAAPAQQPAVEFTQEEVDTINRLMKELNL